MYRTLLIGALSLVGFAAHADETTPVEQYSYGMHLDIARVIGQTAPDEYKDVTPERLIYLDSKGVKHIMEYEVVGVGRTG